MQYTTILSVVFSLSSGVLAQSTASDSNAAAAAAGGLDISNLQGLAAAIPNLPALQSQLESYATVSGFDEFQQNLVATALQYIQSQTFVTALPTGAAAAAAANPAEILNDPDVQSLLQGAVGVVETYISTQTYLEPAVQSALQKDFGSAVSPYVAVATGSAYNKPASPSASDSGMSESQTMATATSTSSSSTASSSSTTPTSSSSSAPADTRGISAVVSFSAAIVAGISLLAILL